MLGKAITSKHCRGGRGFVTPCAGTGSTWCPSAPLPASCRPSPRCPVSLLSPDCSAEESSPAPVKSKYETMDFDSLLQEAQLSLHR